MPRPKTTSEDVEDRRALAQEVKAFMREKLFTEIKMAEALGVSRRTIQMIKAGKVTPTLTTRRKWETLRAKYTLAPSLSFEAE